MQRSPLEYCSKELRDAVRRDLGYYETKEKTMYIYKRTEPNLWTVGFYDPQGQWNSESDWNSTRDAADRVAYLNGEQLVSRVEFLEGVVSTLQERIQGKY